MANPQNLIPQSLRSSKEAREMGRKGGIASGKARAKRKAMRELLEEAMARKLDGGDTTTAEAVTIALVERAMSGDTKAYEVIRDTLGEKPVDKKESSVNGNFSIKWKEE